MALKDVIPLGMSLPHRSPDPIDIDAVRAVATRADQLGFRDLWVTENTLDHVTSFDPVVVLTYAAAVTSRIRLGADVRRHIAALQATRFCTFHSAWLSDTQGPNAETTAVLYRAKYLAAEAVSSITRTALTPGGAHGIFKRSRLEQLFRDGALAEIQPPPTDFCLWNHADPRPGQGDVAA